MATTIGSVGSDGFQIRHELSERDKGEIALKLVKYLMRKRGLTLSQDNMREFGNVAKAIGVPIEELKQFAKPLAQELLEECFAAKQ